MKHFAACLAAWILLAGCSGYMTASEAFRRSMNTGDPNGALAHVNEALQVKNDLDLPEEMEADTPLLLLERATILQALGRYEASAKNFQFADKSLDVLDLTGDTLGSISKFMFSDDATLYKAPPFEKLLINTTNMLNYLALGNANSAQIEARRFIVNRKYLKDREGESARGMLALGSYLCGVAFEMGGETDIAMRHYGDAYEAGGVPTLKEAVRRLASYSGATDPRMKDVVGDTPVEFDAKDAEVVVIYQSGMAPYRYPERMPIGPAVVIASNNRRNQRLSSKQRDQAGRFAAKGLLKWVNYPSLRSQKGPARRVTVEVDKRPITSGVGLDVQNTAVKEFERVKGTLIAASITRLITRAIAGSVGEGIGAKATGNKQLGFVIGLLLEGAMTAADTPDTRSWVTLPAQFHVARVRVPAGAHTVEVISNGRSRQKVIKIQPGGWVVLNFSGTR
jgi:uncharacterized protein